MGDEHDRLAVFAVELAKQGENLGAAVGVEVARRLVGEDDLGLVHEGPGDGDALLLAAGELARLVIGPLSQTDQGEGFEPRLLGVLASDAGVVAGQEDVLEGGEGRDQVEVLEDEAHSAGPDLGSSIVGKRGHVLSREVELGSGAVVRVGSVEQAQDVHESALAGSGRAHDRYHLARLDRDLDALEGFDGVAAAQPVGLAEVSTFEDCHRSVSLAGRGRRPSIWLGWNVRAAITRIGERSRGPCGRRPRLG